MPGRQRLRQGAEPFGQLSQQLEDIHYGLQDVPDGRARSRRRFSDRSQLGGVQQGRGIRADHEQRSRFGRRLVNETRKAMQVKLNT